MQFHSFAYALLLGTCLALFWGLRKSWRPWILLAASLVFYGAFSLPFLALMVATALVDGLVGRALQGTGSRRRRLWILGISLSANLGVLAFFKYSRFVAENLLPLVGPQALILAPAVVLPPGISFYTFQSLSYVLDVYRGTQPAERRLPRFLLFVTFFPQLVAGPVERAGRLMHQLDATSGLAWDSRRVVSALPLIAWGLVEKCVLADNAALLVDPVFADPAAHDPLWRVAAVYAFAAQIYFDFAGYSDIARGSARLFGVELMVNFRQPYLAIDPSDFWRRWHVSMSEWFRDYLYVPLGGNRGGRARTLTQLMATMLLAGLWHGAAWTFVLWGAWHGLLLLAYRVAGGVLDTLLRPVPAVLARGLRVLLLFHLVCAGWILFRARSVGDAWSFAASLVDAGGALVRHPSATAAAGVLALVSGLGVLAGLELARERWTGRWMAHPAGWGIAIAVCAAGVALLAPEQGPQFLYFQF